MWGFDGTPQALLPRILGNLDRARTEARPQLWFLRTALAGLVGRYILEDRHGPVAEPERSWFLRESTTRLLAVPRDHFSAYSLWAEDYALDAETDDELWFTVCVYRSALQLLVDDYAHTPVPDALELEHLDEIDAQIRTSVKYAWPVAPERIPSALTGTHWWWRLPDSAKGYLAFGHWPGHDLSGERLVEALLHRAQFPEGRFDGADAYGADARGIVLARASLVRARFTKADMAGADLTEATATDAAFDRTQLRGARFDRAVLRGTSFIGASLEGASFAGADLTGADLSHAILVDADFRGAELRDTDFTGAVLRGARFDDARRS